MCSKEANTQTTDRKMLSAAIPLLDLFLLHKAQCRCNVISKTMLTFHFGSENLQNLAPILCT